MVRHLTLVLAAAIVAAPAAAQELRLEALSPGRIGDAAAQYVVLAGTPGASVAGTSLVAFDGEGVSQPLFASLQDGTLDDQGYLLVATSEAEVFYGLVAPASASAASLSPESGQLCLSDGTAYLDCVAWGAYPQNAWGLPAPTVGLDQALQRVNTSGQNAVDWAINDQPDPAAYLPMAPDGGTADGGGEDAGAADGGTEDGGVDAGGSGGGPAHPYPPGGGTLPDYQPPGCACSAQGGADAFGLGLLAAAGLAFVARRRRGARR